MTARQIRILYTCFECGIEVKRLACQVKSERVFCSKSCLGKSKRHGSDLVCFWCDSEFYRRFGEQDLGERVNQFCSKECYQEWRAEYRSKNTYLKTGERHTHRVVAEQILGRKLTSEEIVHHFDNNKHNNDPKNLYLFSSQSLHARCHFGVMEDEELQRFSITKIAVSG
jgi:hypothetical protein